MASSFIRHIQDKILLGQHELKLILTKVNLNHVAKKEHLLREGETCDFLFFVVKGCLRLYIINEKGNEQTLQFAIENWWLTDFMSFDNQQPSHFYIQAVENSELIVIHRTELEQLFSEIPKLERYFRMILQKSFAASQMRINYLFTMGAEERYRHFNAHFPGFVQRVPQYMLASYLDFSAEFLSKIRSGKI